MVSCSLLDRRISHLHCQAGSSNHLKLWSSLIQSTSTSLLGMLLLSLLQGEKAPLPRFSGLSPINLIASHSSLEMLGMVAMEKWWWRHLLPKRPSKFPSHLEERVNSRLQPWSSKQLQPGQGLHSSALTTTQRLMTSDLFAALFWMKFRFPL